MKNDVVGLIRSLRERLSRPRSGIAYWQSRVTTFGERAILNIGHSEAELDRMTELQWNLLEPPLVGQLRGDEAAALDFGCGSGRFTGRIADAINGVALGVDPIAALLSMAPRQANVSYALLGEEAIPARDHSVDLVWVCLVLGTIVEEEACRRAASEILRVLAPSGLLFLIENTAAKKSPRHLRFRSRKSYASMFDPVPLAILAEYDDMGEPISVMAGRNRQ